MEHKKSVSEEKKDQAPAPSGVVTTMFTDIVSSTELKRMVPGETSARRDAAYRADIKVPHDAVVLSCVREAGGYLINSTGDGYCVTFVDAEEAILCAMQIQKQLRAHPIPTPLGPLQVRIGLHTGMFEATSGGYAAATLDKTARVQGQANSGEVFISREAYALVTGKLQGITFERAGTFDMKGLDAEVLYRVVRVSNPPSWPAASSAAPDGGVTGHLSRPGRSKRFLFLWPAAIFGTLLLGGLGHSLLTRSASNSQSTLPLGSDWIGSFRFLPPFQNNTGSASLTVTQRSGEQFVGTYATEDNKYEWRVKGTVQGSHLHWGFVQVLKNPGTDENVGKASVDGEVAGGNFTGMYHEAGNPNDAAQITLQIRK